MEENLQAEVNLHASSASASCSGVCAPSSQELVSAHGHQDGDVPGAERDGPPAGVPGVPLASGMFRWQVSKRHTGPEHGAVLRAQLRTNSRFCFFKVKN